MKYLNLNECKYFPRKTIVKASPVIASLAIVAVSLLIGGVPGILLYKGEMPLWGFLALECTLGLAFYSITIVTFLKTLKESNWFINVQPTGLLIKFRSFHNAALPKEDKQVVQVDFSEIESINKTRIERRTSSLRGKKQTEFITCLDIHLNSCDVSQLKELISEEKKKRIQKKNGSSITRHYPVNVVEDKIIRIELRGSKPLTGKVVKILSQYVKADSAIKISEDFTGTSANKAEIETKILQLVEQGNKIAAIGLLRRNNSMSLSEAKKFVDELS